MLVRSVKLVRQMCCSGHCSMKWVANTSGGKQKPRKWICGFLLPDKSLTACIQCTDTSYCRYEL